MYALQINTTACDGSDMFWPWIFWLLGAFLLGLILGWLLKHIFGGSSDIKKYFEEIKSLEAKLAACRKEKDGLSEAVASAKAAASASSFAAAPTNADDSVKDDLTKVEGIGPKIKGLLNDDGIWSFLQLADSEVGKIAKILKDAGPRYRMHNPGTWPDQARLAAEGKWKELKEWQDKLKGGR